MDSNDKNKQRIKQELANYLGIDLEDIEDESTLTGDLHMKAVDLTDFIELLSSQGFDTSKLDLTEIDTFSEFIETLTPRE
jgi:acyl carrier protein